MRIGDMALHAIDMERAGLRAAPADLDAVAQRFEIGGLAQYAVVEGLAARRRPLQELDGAVDGDAFLIAGDEKRDRAFAVGSRLAAMGRQMRKHGRDAAGDAALHVDRAAPIEEAVLDLAGKRAVAPGGFI